MSYYLEETFFEVLLLEDALVVLQEELLEELLDLDDLQEDEEDLQEP